MLFNLNYGAAGEIWTLGLSLTKGVLYPWATAANLQVDSYKVYNSASIYFVYKCNQKLYLGFIESFALWGPVESKFKNFMSKVVDIFFM